MVHVLAYGSLNSLRKFKSLKIYILTVLIFSSAQGQALPSPIFKIEGKEKAILKRYFSLHERFSKIHCKPGVEQEFNKLDHNYKGDGLFIPLKLDGSLDKESITKNISIIEKKVKYIESLVGNLKKVKSFKSQLEEIKKLQQDLSKLLNLKYEYKKLESIEIKEKLILKAKTDYDQYKGRLRKLFNSAPHLLPFNYPVDYFNLRLEYDKYKGGKDEKSRQKMNEIYLYRKIVEDGAQDSDHTRNDLYLRSLLSTISLRINGPDVFLSEDLRYDIDSALDGIEHQLRLSKKKKVARLGEWLERTKRSVDFYRMLADDKVVLEGKTIKASDLISEKAKARYLLQEFVLKKEMQTYQFWSEQEEIYRALFSLETILFNEVGTIDSIGAPERKDVTQVVINRRFLPKYSIMTSETDLFNLLEKEKLKTKSYPWLNTMFKQGEFSFTYFFISGNLRIYCPDMSRRGKKLRSDNLNIVLDALRAPNYSFKALRYFSRASMLGRIDMGLLWNDYEPINETPGLRINNDKAIKRMVGLGRYQFLYDFTGPNGVDYIVIRIGHKTYVKEEGGDSYFYYRNPHYFRYFKPVSLN